MKAQSGDFFRDLLNDNPFPEDNITSPIIKRFRRAYLDQKYKEIDRASVDALLKPRKRKTKKAK